MDALDRKILNVMLEGGEAKYQKIARKLSTTVGTVHNRIKKLREEGVILQMSPLLNYKKLGYGVVCLIQVSIKGGHLSDVQNKYSKHKNVCSIYDITGGVDTIFVAKFKSTDELNTFIKKLMADEHVERTNTSLVLEIVKETCVPFPLE